ncbi:MAG TPA: DUF5947 family protein, partial [Dehalococcoidia bacterium]|nr:DUF5947 family protein [Dehalococcoidia bacterium]
TDFALSRGQWESLAIPVSMVFVLKNSTMAEPVAFYPSPAGAVESAIALKDWNEFVAENPGLDLLQPDVEAALLRSRDHGFECHIVPIDRCYELVGQLRILWRGFEGGEEVHERLDAFFGDVAACSQKVGGHAE